MTKPLAEPVLSTWKTRVLKSHVSAAYDVLVDGAAIMAVSGREGLAKIIAEAVVTAEDGLKTRYVVLSRETTGRCSPTGRTQP